MSVFSKFFKDLSDCLAGIVFAGKSKAQNSRLRKRRLNFEVLENRELLSANPIDESTFDWSWGENSESPPVIYLPQIDVYAINSDGCVPFTPVDFLLSSDTQVKDNDSLGGDISTGGNTASGQVQIDDNDGLDCSNAGEITSLAVSENFTGSNFYSYEIQEIDQDSNSVTTVASGFIAVEVLPDNVGNGEQIDLPAGFNIDTDSSSFGQTSIAGSGSQISVSDRFTPSINDTYIVSASFTTDSGDRTFGGVTGTGSETLDIKISSDCFDNGDWFYAETVAFSYSLTTDTGVYWGGYSYSLFAGSIDGDYHHTFILNSTDYFFVTENITDQQTGDVTNSYTSQVIGGTVNTTYINYSDNSSQINSTELHNTATASHNISYGTYQYIVSGGTVDGTFESAGESRSSSLQQIINVTENDQTTTTGNFILTSKEETKYIYDGSGEYLTEVTTEGSDDFTRNIGTITESGFTIDTSDYSVNGNLDSDGEWSNVGSANLTHEYESNFYNYDKFKFLVTSSDTSGSWTDEGRYITESTTEQLGEQTTTTSLELNETSGEYEWKTISGNGNNDVTTLDFTDNKVTRTYELTGSASGKSWTTSGTAKQRDKTEYETERQVISTWDNTVDEWIYVGSGTGSGSNFSKSKFDESGTYESTTAQDNIEFSITDGTMSRSGLDKSETTFTTESELVDGEWVESGTGSAEGISKSKSEYSGEGTFELTIVDTRIVGDNILSGDVEESGNEKYKSTWTSEIEFQDGEWITVSGDGETTSKGKTLFTFDGEVTTTEQYTEDNTEFDLSTARKLSGKEKSKWNTTATNEVIDGEWATTEGNGDAEGLSLQEFSIDSSGTYTTSVDNGNNGFEIEGDIELGESNSEKITSTDTLSWNTTTSAWEAASTIDLKIKNENYYDRTSSSGSFWENEPDVDTTVSIGLFDGSTGTLATQSSGSSSGDLTEEYHTTYLFKADYSISIDTAGNETLIDGGTTKTKWHKDSEVTWDGDGEFSRELTYKNQDDDITNVTTINGTTEIDDKTTTVEYNETVKEEIIDGEWKLESGSYKDVTKESGTTKVTTDITSENYFGSNTETKTTNIIDKSKTKTKEVYKGEVVDGEAEGDDKVWEYSATLTDNSSGKYSYTETIEDAVYSRAITGGTVSGTITISITNEDKYGADDIQYKLEGEGENAEWKLISGSRWTESSISEMEECTGSGSYSTSSDGISLTGTISESWTYSTTSTDAKVTETYNATTEEWEKSSGQGSIQYSENTTFTDTATGSFEVTDGTGTINNRKISEDYSYTVTEYLSSGIIDYDQTITSVYKYDAEQTTSTEQTSDGEVTGERKQWTKDDITSTKSLVWSENIDGEVEFTSGSYESSFSCDSGVSFTMDSNGAGTTNFEDYSYNSQITSESDDYEETLYADFANDYLLTILLAGETLTDNWLDDFWAVTGGTVTSEEIYELAWTKSNEDSEATQTISGHSFLGTLSWSEEYEVERQLTVTEVFSDGSEEDIEAGIVAGVTGEGTETVKHYRNDNFAADEETYTYYNSTGTRNAGNESSSNQTMSFEYTYITNSEDEEDWYWQITGDGQIASTSDWYFENSLDATYTSGEQEIEYSYYEKAEYYEILIVNQTYDNENGWVLSSIVTEDEDEEFNENEGEGNGVNNGGNYIEEEEEATSYAEYDYEFKETYKVTADYSRLVAGLLTVTGTEFTETKSEKTEHQDISHTIVDNVIVREIDGEIVETNETSSGYSGSGNWTNNTSTTILEEEYDDCCFDCYHDECYCGCVPVETHTYTNTSEESISLTEYYLSSFEEVINTDWSQKVDDNGELQIDTSAVAELTTKAEGDYSYSYFSKTTSEVDSVYGNWGNSNSYTENTTTIEVSENYESELTEVWTLVSGEEVFLLDSREGTLSGSGDSFYETSYETSYESESNFYDTWYNFHNGISHSEYESNSTTLITQTAEYSYSGDWDGTPSSIENNITGQKEVSSDSYWHHAAENYFTDCDYIAQVNSTDESESESSQYIEYEYDETVETIGFGDGFANVYDRVRYNQLTANDARDSYSPSTTAIDVGGIDLTTLENPHTNYLEFNDLTTGKPNFSYAVDEMPEPKGEEPVVPETPKLETQLPAQESSAQSSNWCDWLQFGLDIVGFGPFPIGPAADATNGVIHIVRGNYVEATFSAIAIIPIVGDTVAGARKLTKAVDKAGDIIKNSDKVDEVISLTKNIADTKVKNEWTDVPIRQMGGCFLAGTLVSRYCSDATDQRELTGIENVKSGDLVWACNPRLGKWEPKIVIGTSTHLYEGNIVKLIVNGEAIEATDTHPVWVVTGDNLENRPECINLTNSDSELTPQGRWMNARDVQIGDIVLSRTQKTMSVSNVESRFEIVQVYNFIVDDLHSYAIGIAEILVHNQSMMTDAIVEHIIKGRHFPNKSASEIKALLEATMRNGKSIPDPGGIPGRVLYYDSNTRIIVILDGKGGGTMFRPNSKFNQDNGTKEDFERYLQNWKNGEL